MFSKKAKKGFTLIEMLIVIVIIGILAAALIPRLSSARGRANDVARKADIAQVGGALLAYQIDNGGFPLTGGSLSGIKTQLMGAGLNSIPTDPNANRYILGIANGVTGHYSYTPIRKAGVPNNGFVLMAGAETEGGANRVTNGTTVGVISAASGYEDIILCRSFNASGTPSTADATGKCTYNKTGDQLRYIYVY